MRLRQFLKRATDATHHIAALHRDLAGQRLVDRTQQRRDAWRAQLHRSQRVSHNRPCCRERDVVVQRGIGVGRLERNNLRVAIAAVAGDHHARPSVVNPVTQRLVAEATKHWCIDDASALGTLRPE